MTTVVLCPVGEGGRSCIDCAFPDAQVVSTGHEADCLTTYKSSRAFCVTACERVSLSLAVCLFPRDWSEGPF